MKLTQDFFNKFKGNIKNNVNIANYNWFNLGGPAEYLFKPENKEQLIVLFIIPLSVQWWSSWYPGSEPGGGGYVDQRMLDAKNEKTFQSVHMVEGNKSAIKQRLKTLFRYITPS